MTELSQLINATLNAAEAASLEPEDLFSRLATRLESVHVDLPAAKVVKQEPRRSASYSRRPVRADDTAGAAAVLRCDDQQVRRLIAEGRLQATVIEGQLMVPTWQYDRNSPTGLRPHLGAVISAAHGRYDWVELAFTMTTPQPSLVTQADRSVIEWLHLGLAVEDVVNLIKGGAS